ncbi:RING finger domain-containing protein [Blastomyces dermatitidis ER-3]|uniref:RING-type E3 ubiquitin transferase n=2 Tax=Ajellomyces dermatitidis TaxID=5039 RepID=F2TAL1_AJEDA|nr:RING finger domain-containing protein [Blastomyces dermatitidis ER-3]EEQ91390.1 RING finger domain-containing protein [Blastomyces dermatitidis ER-3]EGE80274.1 RING finger domain-containing protein [Blastomyces dermatitidis ATCC 18188]
MAQDVDLQQEILRKTLDEVADTQSNSDDVHLNPCVICLEQITEAAAAQPCKHASFDFLCLLSWLQQRPACPLCQATVTSVKYGTEIGSTSGQRVYRLPPPSHTPTTTASRESASGAHPHPRRFPRPPRHRPRRDSPTTPAPDDPVIRRRHIYRHQLYSRRVGTNRLSQYRELTPQHFNQDDHLVSRARKWIRRELQVFAFLNPTSDTESSSSSPSSTTAPAGAGRHRAANNAEFLLEYIIAILRTVDVKGSSGQAEELLREFIGRKNARLFLHELQAWLRSPYNSLTDWDRAVQYDDVDDGNEGRSAARMDMESRLGRHADARTLTRSLSNTPFTVRDRDRGRDRGRSWPRGRVSKATSTEDRGRFDSAAARARRIQRARDRYQPD